MRFSPRHVSRNPPAVRRATCALLVVAFAITASGVPLPVGSTDGNDVGLPKSTEVFPCAESACGCATADQCWKSCCCHSFAERIAWARKYGVRPPDFAIAQARAAGHDLRWLSQIGGSNLAAHQRDCCTAAGARAEISCCETRVAVVPSLQKRTCCSQKPSPSDDAKDSRKVVAWRALRCGGHSSHWLAAIPQHLRQHSNMSFDLPAAGWLPAYTAASAVSAFYEPAVPPPKQA